MKYANAIWAIWMQLGILTLSGCSSAVDHTGEADPLVGSGGHGHVFVGACVPHGMVAVGPNNVSEGWDWCSGYHDSDRTIAGFAQNHLSGTGIADLGEIVFMPFTGAAKLDKGTGRGDGYAVPFDKADERVTPGYYAVELRDPDISVELTATSHTSFHRYFFHDGADTCKILIDLKSAPRSIPSRRGCVDSWIEVLDSVTVAGWRKSDEWAPDEEVWFAARFSKPFSLAELYSGGVSVDVASGDDVRAVLGFAGPEVEAKVALSYVSREGALGNLDAAAGVDFEGALAAARGKWREELSTIDFRGIDRETDRIFYSALYHTALAPQVFSDLDGNCRRAVPAGPAAMAGNATLAATAGGFTAYTVFSLWDTYRAANPLYTLIDKREGDYVNSLAAIAEASGRLPVWNLAGRETDCMVGVHSVPVMVDAALKGVDGVDPERILALVRDLDSQPVVGMAEFARTGWIPADKVNWSVSRALEYCIDADAVARLARSLGDDETATKYAALAKNYRNCFDPETGFMRGRLADGSWREPFDPARAMHEESDYIEGNACQYTWLVPHDFEGLTELFGGNGLFIKHLDDLFSADPTLNEGASADISGMIGQYAHGNEPSHHIAYLHTLAGAPGRTAELVRRICREFYSASPDGLIGNEDCGQMSAWYIFSALGFYPVDPTAGIYVFGSPLARKAVIHTVSGRDFRIRAKNNGHGNIYIKSATLNGRRLDRNFITHAEILAGGDLVFTMTGTPPAATIDTHPEAKTEPQPGSQNASQDANHTAQQ